MTDIIACVAVPVSRGTLSPGAGPEASASSRPQDTAPGRTGPFDDDSERSDLRARLLAGAVAVTAVTAACAAGGAGGGAGAAASWAATLNVRGQVCTEHL